MQSSKPLHGLIPLFKELNQDSSLTISLSDQFGVETNAKDQMQHQDRNHTSAWAKLFELLLLSSYCKAAFGLMSWMWDLLFSISTVRISLRPQLYRILRYNNLVDWALHSSLHSARFTKVLSCTLHEQIITQLVMTWWETSSLSYGESTTLVSDFVWLASLSVMSKIKLTTESRIRGVKLIPWSPRWDEVFQS